jgi:hypothetical protein
MRGKPTNLVPLFITVLAVAFASAFHVLSRKLAERAPDRLGQRMEIGSRSSSKSSPTTHG